MNRTDHELDEAPTITMHKSPFLGRAEYDIDLGETQHRIRVTQQTDGRWASYLDGVPAHQFALSPIHALAQALERLDTDISSG